MLIKDGTNIKENIYTIKRKQPSDRAKCEVINEKDFLQFS